LNLLKLGVGILCHGWMGFYLDLWVVYVSKIWTPNARLYKFFLFNSYFDTTHSKCLIIQVTYLILTLVQHISKCLIIHVTYLILILIQHTPNARLYKLRI
jgi:hypothetical protein